MTNRRASRATSRPISSPAARRWWPRLEAAHILIHEKKLSSLQPLVPILEAAVQTAKPLLLVAEDIERRRHRSGGGAASLRAQAAVGKLKDDNPDIQAGINIVLRALEAPSHHTPRSTTSAASRRKALIAAVLWRGRVRHQAEAAPDRPRIIALNAPELNQPITLSQTSGRKPRSDPEAQIVRHRKASGLKHHRS